MSAVIQKRWGRPTPSMFEYRKNRPNSGDEQDLHFPLSAFSVLVPMDLTFDIFQGGGVSRRSSPGCCVSPLKVHVGDSGLHQRRV